MGFKKISAREIILISIAGFLIMVGFISNFTSKKADAQNDPTQVPALPSGVFKYPTSTITLPQAQEQHFEDEDQAVQREMKEQMDRDRNQQRQIKMLKMQVEQVDLQLENEKALTQINKLKKENAGYVKDSNSQFRNGYPGIRVIYIGGTGAEKEAIISIDGTSYSVKEKDKPVENMEVLGVTDQGVRVHFTAPQELTTVIKYVQD